jgi:phosphatidylglycerophosphate synthase
MQAPRSISAAARAVEDRRRAYTRPGSLFWTRNVNHRGGSAIALLLVRTRVSANAVTLCALAVALVGAAFVGSHGATMTATGALAVAVVWQLAFCLDCADGQLARARGQASPFGAWLDQLCDFLSHAAILTSMVVYLARELELTSGAAVLFLAGCLGANLLQLFASSQRNQLLGSAPAAGSDQLRLFASGRHLSDWGAFLLLGSLLLPYPRAAAGVVAVYALFAVLTVVGQVFLNWRRELPGPKGEGDVLAG